MCLKRMLYNVPVIIAPIQLQLFSSMIFNSLLTISFFFFPRYKKNLKALYVVHPTNFIKILWNIFKPLIRYLAIYSTHFPVLFKDGMFSNKLLLKRLEVKYVR